MEWWSGGAVERWKGVWSVCCSRYALVFLPTVSMFYIAVAKSFQCTGLMIKYSRNIDYKLSFFFYFLFFFARLGSTK